MMSFRVPVLELRMEGRSTQPEEDVVECKFEKYTPMFHRVLDLSGDVSASHGKHNISYGWGNCVKRPTACFHLTHRQHDEQEKSFSEKRKKKQHKEDLFTT